MDGRYQYSIWSNEKTIDGNRKFNRGRRGRGTHGSEMAPLSPVDPGRRWSVGRRRAYLDYGRLMADKCPSLPVLRRTPRSVLAVE